jgi:hypothetical protein
VEKQPIRQEDFSARYNFSGPLKRAVTAILPDPPRRRFGGDGKAGQDSWRHKGLYPHPIKLDHAHSVQTRDLVRITFRGEYGHSGVHSDVQIPEG